MSVDAPERLLEQEDVRLGEALGGADATSAVATELPDVPALEDEGEPLLRHGPLALAALLSSAAAGVACGGVFAGWLPRAVGALAAALGAGLVFASTRVRRPSTVQLLIPVVAVAAGALLVLPDATGGSANLPSLVAEALRAGGISQPPVPFDPGWRFLLVVGITMLAASAAALAVGLNRAKIAVFLPIPVVVGALLAAPVSSGSVPTVVALALIVASLTVAFGAELDRDGATSAGFEIRRFAKGGVALLALVAVVAAVTQIGVLFPEPNEDVVVPAKRPEPVPPEPDRELFVVDSDRRLPWRVGVLDGYDGEAWLTPPFDTRRFVDAPDAQLIPLPTSGDRDSGVLTSRPRPGSVLEGESETVTVTFTISDVRGHVVPTPPNPQRVSGGGTDVQLDPRTQTLRLPASRASKGMRYTVESPNPAHSVDLTTAGPPPPAMETFLDAPAPPAEVADLILQSPDADPFTRLQFVRQKLYEKVIASGAGQPTPVPPQRVVEILAGEPASPFEITAAEALLARWVGVPSRIGFGYLGGDEVKGGRSIRPRHAGTWLEAYFDGFGWTSIVGTPPRAQASLQQAQKNQNQAIRPSENLTLPAYVPVRVPTVQLLYVLVQFWVGRVLPYVVAAAMAVWLYPGPLKMLRRVRRNRWARRGEPADRVRVAYAGLRDQCADYKVGRHSLTPLELVRRFEHDPEHDELAWLVTRALWGDLARDLRDEDITAAEEMARSVASRMRSVQPATTRLLAYASRASLRDPYNDELPNLWWPALSLRTRAWRRAQRAAAWAGRSLSRMRTGLARRRPATAAVLALVALSSLTGCVQDIDVRTSRSTALPERLVPDRVGDLTFAREAAGEETFAGAGSNRLVGDVRMFSVKRGDEVLGAVQVAALKSAVLDRQDEVRAGILDGIGGGKMELTRLGEDSVYVQRQVDRQLFLWFPPRGAYYQVMVARAGFEEADDVFAEILAFQRGDAAGASVVERPDPRRGSEG